MGRATEHLASRVGDAVGGLLNATLGNAAELIIAVTALIEASRNPEAAEFMHGVVKASLTGSIIGLVTFGDEVIGFSRVVSDQEAISPSEWEVKSDHVPPVGTRVTLILRRAGGWESASGRSDEPK